MIKIAILMGSQSDYVVMKHAEDILINFNISYELKIVSAHRTPELLYEYAKNALNLGLKAIIAGAGGAAHLPGMLASLTIVPVLGVPINSTVLNGQDSLLSIVQMPKGIPVATFAIGVPGAINAALFTISMLANHDSVLLQKLAEYRQKQTEKVLKDKL